MTTRTDEADGARMPFLAHLGELRNRIVISLVALAVGFGATFAFSEQIIKWLARPLATFQRAGEASRSDPARGLPGLDGLEQAIEALFPEPPYTAPQRAFFTGLARLLREIGAERAERGQRLQVIDVTEAFWVNMKVALVAGGFLVLPVILYEVWAFIAPGLHPHERRFALPFVVVSTVCFAIGAIFALTVIIPFALRFLAEYKTANLLVSWTLDKYIDFTLKFTVAFGLIFELPLALTLATRTGLVTPEFLARNRRYAILLNCLLAAILTPTGDAFNMSLMAGPLILLYEVGIISARMFGRRPAVA